MAVIGTGGQARQQLDALGVVRPGFVDVRVWGRDPDHASACVDDLRTRVVGGATVTAASSVQEAVSDADVVITCTAAREPLVQRSWLKPGAHVTAVGSDGVDKQELDPTVLQDADVLVVDSRDQCLRLGELQHAPGEADRAVELGAVCEGSAAGRTDADQLTVCDLTGLGVQDVAAANVVMARAGDLGERLGDLTQTEKRRTSSSWITPLLVSTLPPWRSGPPSIALMRPPASSTIGTSAA